MVKFIAEVTTNHNGILGRAQALIDEAANAGFNAVKFQALNIEGMFSPEILKKYPKILEKRRYDFPPDWLKPLKKRARENGLDFWMSVYCAPDVQWIAPHVDAIKVSSYDVRNIPLLTALQDVDKPIFVSTGMATAKEIDKTVKRLGEPYPHLLHCVSAYPCPVQYANLKRIRDLNMEGYSDHTGQPSVIYRAVHKWDAKFIEMHVDLNDSGGSEAGEWVWPMYKAASTIEKVRDGFLADEALDPFLQIDEVFWRADPADGLRPVQEARKDVN